MKCTNGVDGASAKEDGANVCTPNEFPAKTKRPSFTADSCSQLTDMQMQRCSIEVCEHWRHKEKQPVDSFSGSGTKAIQSDLCKRNWRQRHHMKACMSDIFNRFTFITHSGMQ